MMRRFGMILMCAAALAYGCSDDCGPPDGSVPLDAPGDATADTGTDAGMDTGIPDPCEEQDGDATFHYLVGTLRFELDGVLLCTAEQEAEEICEQGNPIGGETSGFDLGEASCGQPEFTWQGEEGINNMMAGLVKALGGFSEDIAQINETLQGSIMSGDILIIVRVEKWNGMPDDECVDVALLLGMLPEGEDASYLDPSMDGELDPGLLIDINPESFDSETMLPLIGINQQTIEGGVLATDPATLALSLPLGETPVSLTMRDAMVRFDIVPETLSNGILGGALMLEEIVPPLAEALGFGEDLVGTLFGGGADLLPVDGVCTAISLGISVEAVEAEAGEVGDLPDEDAGVDGGGEDAGVEGDAGTDGGG
jgi:hypothetical protein